MTGELKHGTIALITEEVPVIAIATQEKVFARPSPTSVRSKARGAFVILITREDAVLDGGIADIHIRIPRSGIVLPSSPSRLSSSDRLLRLHRQEPRCGSAEKPGQIRYRGINEERPQDQSLILRPSPFFPVSGLIPRCRDPHVCLSYEFSFSHSSLVSANARIIFTAPSTPTALRLIQRS